MTTSKTNQSSTRVGVIGIGSMGKHHVRVYDQIDDANLIGISDKDHDRAQELANKFEIEAVSSEALIEQVDAVSIAVPTQFHREVAVMCVEQGVHILVEKPLAKSVEDAKSILQAADSAGITVQIGHIERFNPVFDELSKFVDPDEIIAVRAERLGPPPKREVTDNAIMDLMIHDIDIIRSLIGSEVMNISGSGTNECRHATATVEFTGGVVASLTASRLTQRKIRQLRVTTEKRVIEVDYLNKSIEIYSQSRPEYVEDDTGGIQYKDQTVIERPQVPSYEPLKAEIKEFMNAINEDRLPEVDGQAGLRAVELIERINHAAGCQ